ncbi:MAG: glycosyltransferase family 39 protein [Acidobacteriota bacterium]
MGVRLAGARPWLCRVVPAVAVFCFVAWCYVSLRSNYSWDDAEPEILNTAWRLASGQSIYRGIDTPPFSFAAYTPLYYALVAFQMMFTGLSFLPAKLISFLAALSVGWAMVRLNREWHGQTRDGLWAAFFLFLIPAFLYNAARSHPQMLAVALSVWSLVFFLRNRWLETVIISPLFAVLAFYTKQTQVALPMAMVIYLALRNRRWLGCYIATCAVAGLIPLIWLQRVTEGHFLLDTFRLANLAFMTWQIPGIFIHFAGPIFLFIGLAVYIAWGHFRKGSWEPIDLYLACVLLTTLVSLGRIGAHGQYVLELLVVVLLFLLRTTGLPSMRGRDVLISCQVLFLLIYAPLFIFLEEGLGDMARNRAAEQIYPLLRTGSGPILSQQASFALFARGEVYVQLMHFTALSRAGLWNQQLLLSEIDKHTFSWVITEFPIEESVLSDDDHERFTPEVVEALRRNYRRQEEVYPYYLYSPRPPGTY